MTKEQDNALYGSISTRSSEERRCYLRPGEVATYVVPGDWVPQHAADANSNQALASSFIGSDRRTAIKLADERSGHTGNDVKFYTTAEEAYADIVEDARAAITAQGADEPAFVIHVGWTCYLATTLAAGTTYADLMGELRDGHVKTRCLYWEGSTASDGLRPDHDALHQAADRINSWSTGDVKAITDDRVRDDTIDTGSHHQKIWVILGRNGLSAFYGGCDIHTNRILAGGGDSKCPWHDVHARVRGPAAERFLAIALFRIVASVELGDDAVRPPETRMELIGHRVGVPERHQVAHELYLLWSRYTSTHGARRTYGGNQPSWVRAGDTIGNLYLARTYSSQIHSMVQQNISHAKRFIYVEDQYFWAWEFAQKLGNAVRDGRVQYVVVLTNVAHGLAEQPQHTHLGLAHLAYGASGHTDRVFVFERDTAALGRYVHSKTLIYDDVCVHTGSANFNWRGYTHDSESAAVAVDRIRTESTISDVAASAARNLRAKLWSKHLGVDTRHLFDPIGAMAYFRMVERGEALPSNIMASGGVNKLSMPSLPVGGSLVPWRAFAPTQTTEPPRDITLATAGLGLAAEAGEAIGRYYGDGDTESFEWLTDPRAPLDPP